jgi:hypothetical protein
MNIRIWIETIDGNKLQDLGTCTTDSPSRAMQMYEDDVEAWANKDYACVIEYEEISA